MNSGSDLLKEIFGQALQIKSAAERETCLARACQGERELRQQVETLLRTPELVRGAARKTMRPHLRRSRGWLLTAIMLGLVDPETQQRP